MTDTPAHGPDSSTPPEGSGSGKSTKKRTRQRRRRKRASKATAKGKRRRTPRGTAAEVELMVALVFDRIVLGDKRRDIMRFVANEHAEGRTKWEPSPRTVDDYIARATERLRELSSIDRSSALASARGRFMLVIRKAHDAGDMGTVRLATRDLARIDGLEPVRVQHSGSVLTEHTGTVQVEHSAKPTSIDEQAAVITGLFRIASERMAGAKGSSPAPPIAAPSSN